MLNKVCATASKVLIIIATAGSIPGDRKSYFGKSLQVNLALVA